MEPAPATPAQPGYHMPAEWEPHEATWIAWPHRRDDWPDRFAPIPWVYGEILRHLHRSEEVLTVRCDPRLMEETRRNWPFLRDRRIDAYAAITQRFIDTSP